MSKEIINNYIEQGFNIIPVKSDKKPAIKSWVNFQKEKINVQKFDELLMEAKRSGNSVQGIAVLTGEISGITVVDFDLGSKDLFEGMKHLPLKQVQVGNIITSNTPTKSNNQQIEN